MRPSSSGARVTPFHEQILKTALVPAERTGDEWLKLRARPKISGRRSRGNCCHCCRRARGRGHRRPGRSGLMQTARHAWVDNQLTFERLGAALDVLDCAGIRTMALKGVPLALAHYPDPSLRPMVDFDLLVDAEQAADTIAALRRAGWCAEWTLGTDFVSRTSEVPCRSSDDHAVLDLHWRLVPWVGRSWTRTIPPCGTARSTPRRGSYDAGASGPRSLAPRDPARLPVGMGAVPRWVADVVVLVRTSGATPSSGTGSCSGCCTRISALPVADALEYVATTFAAAVPDHVRGTLDWARSTRRERRKHRCGERERSVTAPLAVGRSDGSQDRLGSNQRNFSRIGALSSIVPFLRGRTHVDHLWALPFVVARPSLPRSRRRKR